MNIFRAESMHQAFAYIFDMFKEIFSKVEYNKSLHYISTEVRYGLHILLVVVW